MQLLRVRHAALRRAGPASPLPQRRPDLALDVEACGWQIVGPEITEKPAPKDWPLPIAGLDYGSGQYLVRDSIIRGLRPY
jgi:hypothetical protein